MSFLSPILLLTGLIAIPIILMYMLKLRRKEEPVSSIMLWQILLRDRQANAPWQRLKRNWLLFLQLLILTLLVISLARPVINIPRIASGSLVILLDASVSMAATDVSPNRFEIAKSIVSGLIDSLDSNSQMTIIQVANQPVVLSGSERDKNTLRDQLQKAEVTQESANWNTAFALASGAVTSMSDDTASIVIVSDGGIPESGLPPLPAEVRFVSIGTSSDNLAISALAVRPSGLSNELFTSVTNFGNELKKVIVSIYLNEKLINAQEIEIPANATQGISTSNFPTEPGIVTAQLSKPVNASIASEEKSDNLSEDDIAYAVNSRYANRRVLIISPGNFFLDQIFSALPSTQAYRAVPIETPESSEKQFIIPDDKFDLYVLDGSLPNIPGTENPQLPDGNLLLINPPSNPLFSVTGVFTSTNEMQVLTHPLTKFINWEDVHIRQASQVEKPFWAEVLIDSQMGPLVFVGETQGRRIAVLNFNLHDSDLPLQVDFPILFANINNYLLPAQAVQYEGSLQPNQGLAILPSPTVQNVFITAPDDTIYDLSPSDNFYFSETKQLGIYSVNFLPVNQHLPEFFAVNLFNPSESNIQPVGQIQIGRTQILNTTPNNKGQLENWGWFAAAGLLVLFIEWWIYHRHQFTLPLNRLRQLIFRRQQ